MTMIHGFRPSAATIMTFFDRITYNSSIFRAISGLAMLLVLATGPAATRAASISWFAPASIGTADVTLGQAGTVTGAAAWGSNQDIIVTLTNGQTINFTVGTTNGGSGTVADVSPDGGPIGPNTANFSGSGNGNFDTALGGFAYDGNNPVITLRGLTAGESYAVQLFALDNRAGANTRTEAFSDGTNQSATFSLGSDQYVIGSFTATGTTQAINVVGVGQGATNINALVIRDTTGPTNGLTWNIATGGSWNTGSNWTTNTVPHLAGDIANFSFANPTSPSTVTLDGSVSVGALTFNNVNAVTISQGTGGTLRLDNNGSAANVQVFSGNLVISAPVALNSPAALTIGSSASLTMSGGVSDGGSSNGLTVNGGGTLRLSGVSNYTGGTTINTATLNAIWSGGGDFAALPVTGSIVNNGLLILTRNSSDAAFKGVITGAGGTTIAGDGGFLNLGTPADGIAHFSAQGDLTVNIGLNLFGNAQTIGALNGSTGGAVTSNGGLGGSTTLTLGNNNHSGAFNGTISNGSEAIAITKVGAGTQGLNGSNSNSGIVTISAGTLSVSSIADGGQNSGLGRSSNSAANLLVSGGAALQYSGGTASTDRNFTIAPGGIGSINVSTPGTNLTLTGGAAATTGTLGKTGAGILTLTGATAQTGGVLVNGGVLAVNSVQTYGGATTIQSGTLRIGNAPSAVVAGAAYYLDATSTASVVTSGSSVTAWNDLSGNGRNFASNLASHPTLVASAINGHAAIRFDGTNPLDYAGNMTAQSVFIVNSSNSGGGLAGIWGEFGGDRGIRLNDGSSWQGNPAGNGNGNDFTSSGSTYITTPGAVDVNTNSFGAQGTPHVLAATGNVNFNDTSLGGYYGGRYWAGDIGAVVVYSNQLNGTDRQAVEQYLSAEFFGTGSAINNMLPSNTAINLAGSTATFDLGFGATTQTIGSLAGVSGSKVTMGGSSLVIGGDNTDSQFDGVISGSGALTKNGLGTLTLNGANTYTGVTTIHSGSLRVSNLANGGLASSVGQTSSAAGNLLLGAGATLQYSGASTQTNRNFTIANGGVGSINVASASTILTLTGGAAATTGTLAKTGPGVLALVGPNAQSGGVLVNGGVLFVANAQTYGGATTIQSGTLRLSTAPSAPVGTGLQYQLDASNPANLTVSGGSVSAWNDSSGHGVAFTQPTAANQPTYNATGINGLGAVAFDGGFQKLVSSTTTATQTVFFVNQVAGYSNLNGIFGQDNGDFGIRLNNPTAWQNGAGNANNNDFSSGGAMSINGLPVTGNGTFAASQPHILEAVSSGVGNFTAGLGQYFSNAGQRAYNGQIGEVLVYNGVLSAYDQQAVNSYLTNKWLGAGAGLGASNLLPTSTAVNITGSGASLDLGYGSTTQTIGSLAGVTGSTVNLGANTLITGGDNSSTQYDGVISGPGSLVKAGAGTFTLTGTHAYTGGTAVIGGTLRLGDGTTRNGSVVGNIATSTAVVFANPNAQTYAGIVSGAGSLSKTGAGSLTLLGNNAQTGGLNVNGGMVTVTTAQSYSGVTNVQSGTLRLGGLGAPVAGEAYWLNANAAGSVTTNGSLVTAWNDLSGNNRNFVTNGDAAPSLVAGAINGHSAVRFNGGTTSLSFAGSVNAQTVFIVNTSSGISPDGVWGWYGHDNGIRLANNSNWLGQPNGGGDGNDFANGTGGNTYITTATIFDANTTNFGSAGTPHILTAYGNATYDNTGIGRYYSGGRFWSGDIGEILVYSTQLSNADRQSVEQYLSAEWFSSTVNNLLPTSSVINLSGTGATLDLGLTSQTVASLTGVAGSSVALSAPADTLTVAGASTATYAGSISGSGSLAVTGSGSLTLSGANSYTGTTRVGGGALRTTGVGTIGTGPLAINAAAGISSMLSIGNSQTVSDLSVNANPIGVASLAVGSGKTLTVSSSSSAGSTTLQGALNVTGPGTLRVNSNSITFADNSALNVQAGTVILGAGSGATGGIGQGVTATVASMATLELANSVSQPVPLPNRIAVSNDGALVVGDGSHIATQQVGGVDGIGSVAVQAGSSLTVNHIDQTSLTIGAGATFTLDASDASGNPLTVAASLVSSGSFASSASVGGSLPRLQNENGQLLTTISLGGKSPLAILGNGLSSSSLGSAGPSSGASLGGSGSEITAVAEPSTAVLLLIGAMAAWPFARRKTRRTV